MVPKWNHFIFMQIDYPRWPPGDVTKNSINTKMTVSRELFVEIDPALCQNVSCISRSDFFEWNYFKFCKLTIHDGCQGPLLK